MSARKTFKKRYLALAFYLFSSLSQAEPTNKITLFKMQSTHQTLAQQLGWVASNENYCGGFYLEEPFTPLAEGDENAVHIRSHQTLFSQHGTSVLEGGVIVGRANQQMTANKAYLYRDAKTNKLNVIDMIGDVHFREPNTLIISKKGRYNFVTKTKSLIEILYRTTFDTQPAIDEETESTLIKKERKITGLTAWGKAYEFSQTQPKVYELSRGSYSTCPPTNPAWRLKAGHIELDKNAGRGTATNVKILVKNIPVFYTPYISFPIDSRRKTGFLFPTLGVNNNWGPYMLAPFYWNMAPNYDMTLTPGIFSKRGIQLSDNFRYLTSTSEGEFTVSVLPNDSFFADFQQKAKENPLSVQPAAQPPAVTEAEINRLLNDSTTRKSFAWRNQSRYNEHWSSKIDFNYAGDDYYLRDFGNTLNEITENQLLQEGDLYYKGQNWNFIGRLQSYQTLHPVDSEPIENQYRRLPQLILSADYPDQPFGLQYFIANEVTHFELLKTPGSDIIRPIGNRLHTQPGISLPMTWPYLYINPRLQLAMTEYDLYQTSPTNTPSTKKRVLPIFDIASGLFFTRDISLFGYGFQQTLEPQFYYTYIPYRNQASIPTFDTTVVTLTYDQLFNYNRFTGLDRIGDANQLATGMTTRFIDQESGIEKVRLGVGAIAYFAKRRVTFCNTVAACTDNPENHINDQRLSPFAGTLSYTVNPHWSVGANTIWNPVSKQVDNGSLSLHYEPLTKRIINLTYSFARNGDYFSGINTNTAQNNIKLTDISFEWPVFKEELSAVGRWSQDWNKNHFQNLLFGVQYDSCCWAIRAVGERVFTRLSSNNTPQYNSGYYLQFALKGLGNIGTRDPSGLLAKNIAGYKTQFGQVF